MIRRTARTPSPTAPRRATTTPSPSTPASAPPSRSTAPPRAAWSCRTRRASTWSPAPRASTARRAPTPGGGLVSYYPPRADLTAFNANDGPDAKAFSSVNDLGAVSGATPQLEQLHRSAHPLAPVRRRQLRHQGRDVARERHQHVPQLHLLRRRSERRQPLRRLQQLRPRLHRPAVGDLLGADHRRPRRRRGDDLGVRRLLRVRDGHGLDRKRAAARHDHQRLARHRRRSPPRRHRRRQDLPPARALVARLRSGRQPGRSRRHHRLLGAAAADQPDADPERDLDRRQLRLGGRRRSHQPLRRALSRRRHRRHQLHARQPGGPDAAGAGHARLDGVDDHQRAQAATELLRRGARVLHLRRAVERDGGVDGDDHAEVRRAARLLHRHRGLRLADGQGARRAARGARSRASRPTRWGASPSPAITRCHRPSPGPSPPTSGCGRARGRCCVRSSAPPRPGWPPRERFDEARAPAGRAAFGRRPPGPTAAAASSRSTSSRRTTCRSRCGSRMRPATTSTPPTSPAPRARSASATVPATRCSSRPIAGPTAGARWCCRCGRTRAASSIPTS